MGQFNKYCRLGAAIFAVAALSAGSLACAASNRSAPPPPDRFAAMDANNDGKVVVEEFTAAFPNMNEKAFVVIDANNDGGIDKKEWYDFMEGHSRSTMPGMKQPGAPMNNIPGDPLIPPPDSNDLPLMRPQDY